MGDTISVIIPVYNVAAFLPQCILIWKFWLWTMVLRMAPVKFVMNMETGIPVSG